MFREFLGLELYKWLAGFALGLLTCGWIYFLQGAGYHSLTVFINDHSLLLAGVLILTLLGLQLAFRPLENSLRKMDRLNFYLQRVQRLGESLQEHEQQPALLEEAGRLAIQQLPYSNFFFYSKKNSNFHLSGYSSDAPETLAADELNEKFSGKRVSILGNYDKFPGSEPLVGIGLSGAGDNHQVLMFACSEFPGQNSFHGLLANQLADQIELAIDRIKLLRHEKEVQQKLDRKVKKATEKITEQRNFLQSIVSSLDAGLLVVDARENYRAINRQVLELLELDTSKDLPVNLTDPEAQLPDEIHEIDLGDSRIIEHADRHLEYSWQTIKESPNRMLLIRDRTTRIEMQKKAEFNRSLSMLGDMVASVVHELRNPLGGMELYLGMLKRKSPPEEMQKPLDKLAGGLSQLQRTVEGLLNFTKTGQPEFERLDPNLLIEEVLSHCQDRVDSAGVEVKNRLDNLPEISADSEQLHTVFVNLIQNAVDSEPDPPTIEILGQELEDGVKISVKDYGEGIPEEQREKIFDLFHSSRDSGTGLGLTISRRIIEIHSGEITVQSTPGETSTFTVFLPKTPDFVEVNA